MKTIESIITAITPFVTPVNADTYIVIGISLVAGGVLLGVVAAQMAARRRAARANA